MHVTEQSKTVVMLIDWDNLQICHSRDAPGTELDLQALIALAQSYGTLVSARAYAEWNLLTERLAVYKAGIEPVFAPVMRAEGSAREGKSLADTVMVADGVDLLWTVSPDVFVLVTSDKDMIPLARIAKQRGAAVVVLGSDLTAIQLVEVSNVFITYRQLLRELDRVVSLEAPVGRAPARERRLRETHRPSSEPFGSEHGGTLSGSGLGTGGRDRSRGGIGTGTGTGAGTRGTIDQPPRRTISRTRVAAGGEPASSLTEGEGPTAEVETGSIGIGLGEPAPRRRRRRGGRGRRGESSTASEPHVESGEPSDSDEAAASPEDVPSTLLATGSSPEDIDRAVLELLGAGTGSVAPAAEAEVSEEETETPTPTAEVEAEPASTPAAEEAPAQPRRPTIRRGTTRATAAPRRRTVSPPTGFSDFGPPSTPARASEPTPEPEPAVVDTLPAEAPAEAPTPAVVTNNGSVVDETPSAEDPTTAEDASMTEEAPKAPVRRRRTRRPTAKATEGAATTA